MMTTEASSSFASSSSASSSSSSSASISVSVSVSEDESLRDWNALPLCVLREISSKIPASYLANRTWMFQQWRTMREQGTLASWHCRILSGQAELPAEFYTLWLYSDDSLFTVKFTESKGIAKPVRGKGLMNLNGVRVWGNSTGISLIQPKEGHPTLFLMNSTTGEVNKNIRDPPTKARVEYGIRNENEAVISFGMGDEGGDLYIGKVVE